MSLFVFTLEIAAISFAWGLGVAAVAKARVPQRVRSPGRPYN